MKRLLKCSLSPVDCVICKENPKCPIYTDRYVLRKQLQKFKVELEDTLVIVKAILRQ